MADMGVGPKVYKFATGVSSLSLTPLADRALRVTRILLDNVSASDIFRVIVDETSLGDFLIRTGANAGSQQLLSAPTASFPKNNDIFAFLNNSLGLPLTYPVPNGSTFTIASLAGATADIVLEYQEVPVGNITTAEINHRAGTRKVFPVYFSVAATVNATGEQPIDTQHGLQSLPALFDGSFFPPSRRVQILGLFLEGLGVNTFNGGADHQSKTDHLAVVRNDTRLFNRDPGEGFPLVGADSAAGSANAVNGTSIGPLPAFQEADWNDWMMLDNPISYTPGDQYFWYLGVTGDVTGGADYSSAIQVAIVDMQQVG